MFGYPGWAVNDSEIDRTFRHVAECPRGLKMQHNIRILIPKPRQKRYGQTMCKSRRKRDIQLEFMVGVFDDF